MATVSDIDRDILEPLWVAAGRIVHAYMECSDEIQQGVRKMFEIVLDPNVDPDDRDMALATLKDALFPETGHGKLGIDLDESEGAEAEHCEECRRTLEEMDQEEIAFAGRLRTAMQERGMNQSQLAERLGIGQPAVSNMLNRQCRPQRQTVVRLAGVLNVPPESLWPGFEDTEKGL